ncbi:MAG: tRNA(Ile)-lysidine synthetase, partial [Caulobacterales bacterium]|nr:tRNA(Ile)-lysidine synthetase [Caulobacterales bacterium]
MAVAFSGGGDSAALLLIARDWARASGRALVALIVDHDLRPDAAADAAAAAAQARGAG